MAVNNLEWQKVFIINSLCYSDKVRSLVPLSLVFRSSLLGLRYDQEPKESEPIVAFMPAPIRT